MPFSLSLRIENANHSSFLAGNISYTPGKEPESISLNAELISNRFPF
jgi:hypothetical protein